MKMIQTDVVRKGESEDYYRGYEDGKHDVQQALDHYLPKWISVKERLPEKDETVIICFRQSGMIHVTSAEWKSWDGRFWNDRGRLISPTEAIDPTSPTYEVTHWMPLPEPPEIEQENK